MPAPQPEDPRAHNGTTTGYENDRPGHPVLLGALVGIVLLLVAAWVFVLGYLPPDDALRHAGKALTDRSWHEILVMREGVYPEMDSHPGWHAVLGTIHNTLGLDGSSLVQFSVFTLFLVAVLPPVLLSRKPVLWLAALAIGLWVEPGSFLRLFLGRPLLLTMGVALTIILLWQRQTTNRPSRAALLIIPLLVALAVWCHSTWYLFALPLTVFWLTNWRRALWFTLLIATGVISGACLTGHPVDYLFYQLKHLYWTLLEPGAGAGLAGELRPYAGTHYLLVCGLLLSVIRDWRNFGRQMLNPLLLLTVICWLLSFKATRFWVDWGFPCLLLWLASELGEWMTRLKLPAKLAPIGFLIAAVALTAGAWRYREHFSLNTPIALATSMTNDPQTAQWLPGAEGVVYATDMRVFYNLFFLFPNEKWHYAPGFEPGLMPPADARIYRAWRETGDVAALSQWAGKLRPNDRLSLVATRDNPPPSCGLAWHFWAPYYWIGKSVGSSATGNSRN
ncbi:MAG: hypothetical protein SFY80_00375 [Verrucomicrobiota bacterium]|nr:hypothetical protein [Verrucomicrobiota bacterium]